MEPRLWGRMADMDRRQFVSGGAAGLLIASGRATAAAAADITPTPGLMKLGDQTAPTNDTHLKYLARYGVRNICGYPQIAGDRLYATVDELKTMMDMAAKYGISVDCTDPPFLDVQLYRYGKASGDHAGPESRSATAISRRCRRSSATARRPAFPASNTT